MNELFKCEGYHMIMAESELIHLTTEKKKVTIDVFSFISTITSDIKELWFSNRQQRGKSYAG